MLLTWAEHCRRRADALRRGQHLPGEYWHPESDSIRDYLCELTERGLYMVSSQPRSTPEEPRGVHRHQLPYVAAYAPRELVAHMELPADIAVAQRPGGIVVAHDGFPVHSASYNWGGRIGDDLETAHGLDRYEVEPFEFIDTCWGRPLDHQGHYLFSALLNALRRG